MEKVSCLFCGFEPETVFWEENGYKGRKCPNCNLIFISPRPEQFRMKRLYEDDQMDGESFLHHIQYNEIKRLNAEVILDKISAIKPDGDLLEIGAGGGHFLKQARERGYYPCAVEINKRLADFLESKYKIDTQCCKIESEDIFPGKKFDIIYHKDVLSHIYEPVKAFSNLNSKLKEGGIMVFETGNLGDVSKNWLNFLGKLSYPEHVYLYSFDNIKRLLDKTGFKVIKYYRNNMLFPILYNRFIPYLKKIMHITPPPDLNTPIEENRSNNNSPKVELDLNSLIRRKYPNRIKLIEPYLFHFLEYRISEYLSYPGIPSKLIFITRDGG